MTPHLIGELDSITAESIGAMLRSLCSEQNITMVVTTHDIALTSRADRILELADGALIKPP